MSTFQKINKVTPMPDKRIFVLFNNGKIKIYDCNQLLQRPEFSILKDDACFKSVQVDAGGYGISWNDNVDISEYELWTNGVDMDSLGHASKS